MGDAEQPKLDFNAIYFDTEPLVRSTWPALSVELENILKLARLWQINLFIPYPVERQIEERCVRQFIESRRTLGTALKSTTKLLERVGLTADLSCCDAEDFRSKYHKVVDQIKYAYPIMRTEFPSHTVPDMFDLAVRYTLPFEPEQEGKGFQDAVIIASVLQHLAANRELSGVLVTADGTFAKINPDEFGNGFSKLPLRVLTMDAIWKILYDRYWDENIKKPWHEEMGNAKAAVEAMKPQMQSFIYSRLRPEMMDPGFGRRVLEIRLVEKVDVFYAQTPIPDAANPNRHVRFAVSLKAEVRALLERDLSINKLLWKDYAGPLSEQVEDTVWWIGGAEATADVRDRQFTNIAFQQLLPESELSFDKWSGQK